ncbi:MAG TPA: hypothetical protein VI391_04505, partial [Thermoanaerobaculia bacterium]
ALALGKPVCAMSTHEAIAPPRGKWVIVDDAGRGEFYVSQFVDGEEAIAPKLGHIDGEQLRVADVQQRENVALLCARRALAIARAGRLEQYADITPIYVRLAEAEARLRK